MRAPRYRFPDEVRDATRTMATQMVRDDRMARGPADLDAWLAASPEMHATMQRGGYGTAFSAEDLFPLLQVMMTNAGGQAPVASAPERSSPRGMIVGMALLLLVLLIAMIVAVVV